MSIRFQGLEESSSSEPGKALPSSLLKSLHDIRKRKGLEPSDVRDAEQLIRHKKDVEELRNGVLDLFRELNPFDPKQAKVAEVYAELDKIIRGSDLPDILLQASTTGETMRAPLPTSQQQRSNTIKSEWSIGSELQDRIIDLLSDIRREMRGSPEETFYFPNRLLVIEDLIGKQNDWHTLQHAVDAALDQTRKIGLHLQKLRDGLESGYLRDVALRSSIETLQSKLKAELTADSEKGLRWWFQTYAFCLSEWYLDRCSRLVDESIGLPNVIWLAYSAASTYLMEGKYVAPEVDQMLGHLIDTLQTEGTTDRLSLAKLTVLRGRIDLYYTKQPDAALNLFETAQRLCSNHQLPAVALGEYYLHELDYERAEAQFRISLQLLPNLVDSHLGIGRLHEQRKEWEQTNVWYDRAAEIALKNSDAVGLLGNLLAPATGCAYLRLALKLVADRPQSALRSVTHALTMGIQGKGRYPQAEALRLKADILMKLERSQEALEAFSEAAQNFLWNETSDDTEDARKCLESAIQLDPMKVSNFWSLADVYLSLSYSATDDQAKRGHVNRGIALWNAAATQTLPDELFYWAYATRAGLADQQGSLSRGEDWHERIDVWWQAIASMERLLLITDSRGLDWAFLARSFSRLDLYQNALRASEKAFELDSDNLFVAEWRMIVLGNTGHYAEAIDKIEHRLTLSRDPWVYSILAWVELQQERYQEAKEDIERAYAGIEEEKMSIWDLHLRASIYKRAKEWDRANADWEVIYQRIDEMDIGNLGGYANAAFDLGRREEAIKLLQRPILLHDPLERSATLLAVGLFQLRSNHTDEGWKNIEDGISLSRDIRALNFCGAECKEDLNPQDADRVLSLVRARVRMLEQPRTPEEELFEAYATFGAGELDESWVRVGIQAGLARGYREAGQWLEAANIYKQLLALRPVPNDSMPFFPEAQRGLKLCANNVEQLGEESFKGNQANEAIQHYQDAIQLTKDSLRDATKEENAAYTAALHTKLALAMLDTAGVHAASHQLATALNLYRQSDEPNSVNKLGDVLKLLLRDGVHYWQVHGALDVLISDGNKPKGFRQDIVALSQGMSSYLEDRYRLGLKQFETPSVPAIILEIGERLIPADTSTAHWALFTTYIPEMRQRIQDSLGVDVGGVLVRGNSNMPVNGYAILIEEIPLVQGSVQLEMRYSPVPAETLQRQGIPQTALLEAPHPQTGQPGCWVQPEYSGLTTSGGFQLWPEPLVYVICHLERVLHRNLSDLIGIQEVENVLENWAETERGRSLVEPILSDETSRIRFARVLRALLNERVPITDWKNILEAVQGVGLSSDETTEVVRATRLRLRSFLPGNSPNDTRVELPSKLEHVLIGGLRRAGGKTFFALSPEETRDGLGEIRHLIKPTKKNSVLVAQSSELRPYIRRLVEFDFPDLLVISQEELIDNANVKSVESEQLAYV